MDLNDETHQLLNNNNKTSFGNDTTTPELSISLIRLSRPILTHQPLLNSFLLLDSPPNTLLNTDPGPLLIPTSFGNIYLGEPLHFALHLNHHPTDQAKHTLDYLPSFKDISLKVELQTTNNRSLLLDVAIHKIKYLGHYVANLTHDVRELGMHILVVQISYNHGKYLRKFFKFQSLNPFQVKTKTTLIPNNRTILELSIQNLTQTSVQITKSTLVPNTESYTCTTIDPGPSYSCIPGSANVPAPTPMCLMPNDTHQSLYIFTSQTSSSSSSSSSPPQPLGRLELEWAGLAGDGRLQTPPLPVKTNSTHKYISDDLSILHVQVPSIYPVLQPFLVSLKLVNQMRMNASLSVTFVTHTSIIESTSTSQRPSSSRTSTTVVHSAATPVTRTRLSSTSSTSSQQQHPKSSPSVLWSPKDHTPNQPTFSLSSSKTGLVVGAAGAGALTAFRAAVNPNVLQHEDSGMLRTHLLPQVGTSKDFLLPKELTSMELSILGPASIPVGDVNANDSVVVQVHVVGLVSGIHSLPMLRITDAHTGVTRTVDPRVSVWIGGHLSTNIISS